MDHSPRVDLRLRVVARLFTLISKLHLMPDDLGSLPLAKRQAMRTPRLLVRASAKGVTSSDRELPGRRHAIPVRVYRAGDPSGTQPLVLFVHGGGWVSGCLDDMDYFCTHLAARAQATVVSVAYRLAPEHPYPSALEDCEDALEWVAQHGQELGGDPSRLAVMGDSAGGNLAAALSLLDRRRSQPRISFQALLYPSLDATMSTPAMASYVGMGLTREAVDMVLRHYVGGADRSDPLISPLLAEDLCGQPRTLIQTADLDILRDDGQIYADRLAAAGVPVRYTNYVSTAHGFYSAPRLARAEPQAMSELVQELMAALPVAVH